MEDIKDFADKCLHEMTFGDLSTTGTIVKYLDLWNKKNTDWIDPNNKTPDTYRSIIFKLKNNEKRMGVFLEKDQWGREKMFCDGSFHKLESVKGYYYVID